MKKLFLWFIFELYVGLVVVREGECTKLHYYRSADATEPAPARTEAPPIKPDSVLSNYDGLNLISNADQKTIGFVNVTENVGISFSAQEDGDAKILLDSKTGQVLSYKHLGDVALTQNDEFKGDVLKALNIILDNYVFKKEPIAGNSSEIKYSSEDALALWSNVYVHLGHPKEKGSQDYRSLKYLQAFSKRLKHLYLGSLKGLIVGNGPFPLKQNLNRFLTISIGLHKLFSQAPGGLKGILAKNVSFEVKSLFNAKNGAEVFVYVLRQTGAKFDLSELWKNLLSNVDELMDIIEKLGGGETKNGVDETFALIGHFWAAIHLKIPITNFIQFLFESSSENHWSNADDGDLKQVLKDFKNITDQQSKKYDNVIKLSGVVKFITNLTANSLIENNVNISELVEEWRKRDVVGGLKTITHLTLKLFSPDKYSGLLFDSFTAFLNATSDKDAVKKLIPGVPLEDFTGGGGPFWKSICKGYKIDDQLKKGGDPSEVLKGVPVFNEFSKVFKDASGKPFDFAKVLKGGTFSDYLSKLSSANPFKFGPDVFSKFVQGSGDIIKHIFFDPIKNFFPASNFPSMPGLPNSPSSPNLPISPGSPSIPFLPPGILPVAPGEKPSSPEKESSTSKSEEDPEEKETSKKPCDDCDDDESKSPSTEKSQKATNAERTSKKPCEDCGDEDNKSTSSDKPTTSASEGTHLTASISSNPSSDDSEVTKATDSSGSPSDATTKKKCDDCEDDKDTKSSTSDADATSATEETIEFKHHHNRHHQEIHQVKHHHDNKHHIVNNYKNHQSANAHENKHHTRKHQEKYHHTRIQHQKNQHQDKHNVRHNGERRQDKHQARHHKHEHEVKHHQRTLNHQKQDA